MTDPYTDREQTKAKHFILKRYLQALAFKVLRYFDMTYVDGFSGPWKTQTEDFADLSFRIAIDVLKDAQQVILTQTGRRPKSGVSSPRTTARRLRSWPRLLRHFISQMRISKSKRTAATSKMQFPKSKLLLVVRSL